MRRLFAFITLAFSLLVVVIVGIPSIKNTMNSGADFDGGYNIMYHVTSVDEVDYKGSARESVMSTAAKNTNERLNTLNITNPEVAIANDNYLSITIQDLSESQIDVVRFALANNAEVSVRDTSDNLLCLGKDVFEKLTLTSYGDSVGLNVKVKDKDKLEEATEIAAANYSTDDNGQGEINLVIWIGFQENYLGDLKDRTGFEGDHYQDAYSGDNPYATFKILTALSIQTALNDDFSCTANVYDENVALMNKLLDQDSVMFVMTEESTNKIGSFYKANVPTLSIVLGIISLAIICALFIIVYRLSGVASAISIITYGVVTLLLYNTFKGLFGLETIIALAVGAILSVYANIVFLERIKDELRKGKEISRAFDEGSKKSVSSVLDANILVLIASFVLYLFGTQVIKSFAAVLIISEVVIILLVVLVTRYMVGLLSHASFEKNPLMLFGVKDEEIGDINDFNSTTFVKETKFKKVNFTSKPVRKFQIAGIVALAGLVLGMIMQLAKGAFFNYPDNLRNGSRFYFSTFDKQFATEESVEEWFLDHTDEKYSPSKVIIKSETKTYSMNDALEIYTLANDIKIDSSIDTGFDIGMNDGIAKDIEVYTVAVYFDKVISSSYLDNINSIFEAEADKFFSLDDENPVYYLDMNYCGGNYTAYSGLKAVSRALLVLAVVCLFMFVYLIIRFNISYSITAIANLFISEVILFALIAFFRIPVGIEAVAFALGMAILMINTNCITFDRLRESINETSHVAWNKENRLEFVNKAIQDTAYGHAFATVSACILGLLLTGVAFSGVFTGIAIIFAIAVTMFVSLFLMPHIWTFLDGKFSVIKDARKQRKALKKKEIKDTDEVQEYIFFGIND